MNTSHDTELPTHIAGKLRSLPDFEMDLVSPSRLHADSGATHSAPRLHGEHTQQPPQLGGPQALGSYTLSSWCSLVLFWPSALPLGSPPFVTTQFLLHWDKSPQRVSAILGVHHTLSTPTLRPYDLAGGNVKWCCRWGKQHGGSSRKPN